MPEIQVQYASHLNQCRWSESGSPLGPSMNFCA